MDNDEGPMGQKGSGNWVLLFILSLLVSGVLYNVWSLIKSLGTP